jgi:Lanthionine synthetase C-like protein/HopA1 effector protein family
MFVEQVASLLDAVAIGSGPDFTWLGVPDDSGDPGVTGKIDEDTLRAELARRLTRRIYQDFYCPGEIRRANDPARSADAWRAPMTGRLSDANRGAGQWSDGWSVIETLEDGSVLVKRDGLALRVPAGHVQSRVGTSGAISASSESESAPASHAPARTAVAVKLPKELLGMSPGHYLAMSDTELTRRESDFIVRIYWNLLPDGGVVLMRQLTEQLNALGLAFQLKVTDSARPVARCDTAVLYLAASDYGTAEPVLRDVYGMLAPWLRPAVPSLSLPLGRGVSFAEDPPNGQSFGMDRSRLLAEGMIDAERRGYASRTERLDHVAGHFGRSGIDLNRPYAAASRQLTPRPFNETMHAPVRAAESLPETSGFEDDEALGVALAIGRHLAATALKAADRCTWTGFELSADGQTRYQTLGPNLYGGTAGVGLFLAELSRATDAGDVADVAGGALRQAAVLASDGALAGSPWLYLGGLGVAVALARGGQILGDEGLIRAAQRLADAFPAAAEPGDAFDVLAGRAGGILALLALSRMLGEDRYAARAAALGDELILAARRHSFGWSWRTGGDIREHDLLGYSHGAAGVAHAFFALAKATAGSEYLNAARQAVAYERYHFDHTTGHWPDFRADSGGGEPICAWCNGAAGIALSRCRAAPRIRRTDDVLEARHAASAIRRKIQRFLDAGIPDASYCHGLAGALEALDELARTGRCADDASVVRPAARAMADTFMHDHSWRGGLQGRQMQGLMLGSAGVGYFFLRLARPGVPSVLAIDPARYAGSR